MRLRDAECAMRALKKKHESTSEMEAFVKGLIGPSFEESVEAYLVVIAYNQAKRRQRRRIARKAARARWSRP